MNYVWHWSISVAGQLRRSTFTLSQDDLPRQMPGLLSSA
jgi:hypothetical protein